MTGIYYFICSAIDYTTIPQHKVTSLSPPPPLGLSRKSRFYHGFTHVPGWMYYDEVTEVYHCTPASFHLSFPRRI